MAELSQMARRRQGPRRFADHGPSKCGPDHKPTRYASGRVADPRVAGLAGTHPTTRTRSRSGLPALAQRHRRSHQAVSRW